MYNQNDYFLCISKPEITNTSLHLAEVIHFDILNVFHYMSYVIIVKQKKDIRDNALVKTADAHFELSGSQHCSALKYYGKLESNPKKVKRNSSKGVNNRF